MERTVRKATLDDYENVMAIPEDTKLYGGYDYLPHEYHHLLSCHGGYVLEIGNKIVGFLGYEVTDGGRSFIPLAGRICPSLQGQGLFKYLMEAVTEKVKDENPQLVIRRMSIHHRNSFKDRLMKSNQVLFSVPFFCIPLNKDTNLDFLELKELSKKEEHQFTVLTQEDLQNLSECETAQRNLAPCGYFVIDWHVYKFDTMEAESLFNGHRNFHCIASYKKHGSLDQITDLTMICTSQRGKNNMTHLSLDLHGIFTKDLFIQHLKVTLNLLSSKGIGFDETRIVVPEKYGEIVSTIFRNITSNGQIFGLEIPI